MSKYHFYTQCPFVEVRNNEENKECENELGVELEYDPGEKASWGYSGGSPEVPSSVSIISTEICPLHGDMTEEIEKKYTEDDLREKLSEYNAKYEWPNDY